MEQKDLIQIIKKDKIVLIILLVSFFSAIRALLIPLQGDELTYFKLSENLLRGQYYLKDYPSTVTPIIPFLMALFYTPYNPILGFSLMKSFNILITIIGLRYLYLFLESQKIDVKIILSIIILTVVNTHSIAWYPSLYPEAILFISFWGFIYYYSKEKNVENFKKMFIFFILLTMSRYVYAILGLTLLIYYYQLLPNKAYAIKVKKSIIFYTFLFLLPVILWFKYVYHIEQNNLSEISYFNRFKGENSFIYNIKSGLGLIMHQEANRINGIPAFVSTFIPITGFRNYILSIFLIVIFLFGYLKTKRTLGLNLLFGSTVLTMLGLIFAGTGFSRYWLIMLPSFYLGYYLFFKFLKLSDDLFLKLSKFVAIIYIINEIRIDYLIFKNYF